VEKGGKVLIAKKKRARNPKLKSGRRLVKSAEIEVLGHGGTIPDGRPAQGVGGHPISFISWNQKRRSDRSSKSAHTTPKVQILLIGVTGRKQSFRNACGRELAGTCREIHQLWWEAFAHYKQAKRSAPVRCAQHFRYFEWQPSFPSAGVHQRLGLSGANTS